MRVDPGRRIHPHLDRWVSLGLLERWERVNDDARWSEWHLTWWDGSTTMLHVEGMRGAITAIDKLERKLAHA